VAIVGSGAGSETSVVAVMVVGDAVFTAGAGVVVGDVVLAGSAVTDDGDVLVVGDGELSPASEAHAASATAVAASRRRNGFRRCRCMTPS